MLVRFAAVFTTLTLLGACSGLPTDQQSQTAALTAKGSGSAGGSAGGSTDSRVEVILTGRPSYPAAKGKARFRSRGGERELQIEVENLPPGLMVNFLVGGIAYGGTQTVNALGAARINANSDLGQAVPMTVTGKAVQVITTAGALAASGSF